MSVLKGGKYKNLEGDEFTVVKIKSDNDVAVRFDSTGYECRVRKGLLLQGLVRDYTPFQEDRNSWKTFTEEFVNNSGHTFKAISRKGGKVRVVFENTGYFTEVDLHNARAGKVKDPLEISVYGQGYLGVPDKSLPYWKRALQLWQNMMKRCYSDKDSRGYFEESFVDDRWKCFENFLNDISKLQGFGDWLNGDSSPYYNSNLDKDFYIEGNKVYSRHYCRFLPQGYNKSLGKRDKTEKDWA
jgi:hypothetical protein